MRLFCGKQRGSICVFLTLILVPVLLFSGIIVDASRLFASKTVISGAGDLAMNAALAQYDKKLKDEYGLTAMAKNPGDPQEQAALKQMFEESLSAANLKELESDDLSSIIQISLAENGFEAKGVSSSSLANTDVLRQQIVEYMKFRGPVYITFDIIEKLEKLPFDHIEEQKDYVEKKTDYGQKASELDEPLEKAKNAIEKQGAEIANLQNFNLGDLVNTYQLKSVFWLGAKSMQMYLDNKISAGFPPEAPDVITNDMVKEYLDASIAMSEEMDTFPEDIYRRMITLLALDDLIKETESEPGSDKVVSEDNGFSESQVDAYNNILKSIKNNINIMNRNYDNAEKEFKEGIDVFEAKADEIINHGNEAVKQLEAVKKKWEDVKASRQQYENARNALKNTGEALAEDGDGEEVNINVAELEKQISLLKLNVEVAKAYKDNIKELKKLPDTFEKQTVGETEGRWLEQNSAQVSIKNFWSSHYIMGSVGVPGITGFENPTATIFYQETFKPKQEVSESNKKKQEEQQQSAKQEENNFKSQKNKILNEVQNENNLKDIKGFSDRFPSGLAKINVAESAVADPNTDTGNNNATVNAAREKMGWLESFGKCLDNLAGGVLEQAYLMEYISEMFNCMTTKSEDTSLSNHLLASHMIKNGEIEYILIGNSSTALNKSIVFAEVYGARLAIDMLYVFMNKKINATANSVANAVSGATGQAWLYPIIKYGYLCCVAIAMAAVETSKLASGQEVLVWPDKNQSSVMFSYKDYMKLFLLITLMSENGKNDLIARAGDCIQLNIGQELSSKYTMVTLNADADVSTTFLPKLPAFLGQTGSTDDGKRRIKYRSVLAY